MYESGRFDRELQNFILTKAISRYPYSTEFTDFEDVMLSRFSRSEEAKVIANIAYLIEHGLIKLDLGISVTSRSFSELLSSIIATKDGIDLMENDGGLSAILNVTTIKFHHDALQEIANLIDRAVQDPEDKKKFLSQLKQLPYETTKHVSLELVSKGLAQIPDVMQWLKTFLG
ncbi:hypothetical protein GWI78_08880 [Proteus sp. G2658]|uniref:hypothetical protein n=1 Tax=Proteus sp. G2658 TaxID=2698871 RepID=UPI0013768269|nr:hypothetical protein [Proteus sp. G2658]NBM90034.1 hypothetical protein [Proteus sp. G2658]